MIWTTSRNTLAGLVLIFAASPLFAQREHGFDNTKPSGQPYLSPEESVKRMKVADGFEVKLFAAEPQVINPIAFTIDERGRVWVVENFEYPSRTPPGKAPRDRIIILEDTDGDGIADKRTVFCEGKDFPVMKERAEKGLGAFDLASGLEVGHGGVFVGAPPYLWYIENKNDKPGKFEVLLKGFGSQDTHETLNTFQWGPDGRLYGLHGVFTHSDVENPSPQPPPRSGEGEKKDGTTSGSSSPPSLSGKGVGGLGSVKMNAAVWRYDVRTKKFEIFAEGTSNPWGMDFDSQGNCFVCCCVIPHLFHIVPGGIYKRQAGTSMNPYAYGYLNEICDHTFHKESGWAHAGLLCLDNPNVPEEYRTSVIFGSIHGCSIKRNVVERKGSTFVAHKAPDFLVSGDKNFRPINLRWAPDGSILVIDWHDQNPCHQAKPESWDKTHGRVYRIQRRQRSTTRVRFPARTEREHLIEMLGNENPWAYRTAWRLLVEQHTDLSPAQRHDLMEIASKVASQDPDAGMQVRASWYLSRFVADWPVYKNPAVRAALIRNMTELGGAEVLGGELSKLVAPEQNPAVRLAMAGYAVRSASGEHTTALLHELLLHKEDATDPVIPLMLWYAYEKELGKLASSKPPVANAPGSPSPIVEELQWLAKNAPGNPLITDHIIGRAMRRMTATGKTDDLAACVAFVGELKHDDIRVQALEGLVEGLKWRPQEPPAGWDAVYAQLQKHSSPRIRELAEQVAVSLKNKQAIDRAVATIKDVDRSKRDRLAAIQVLTPLKPPEALFPLIDLVQTEKDEELRRAAATALGAYNAPVIVERLLPTWKSLPHSVRVELVNGLKSHQASARLLLDAVGKGTVPRTDLTDNTILAIRAFNDKGLNDQIERVWGRYRPTPEDLEKLMASMQKQIKEKPGDAAKGKLVFEKNCMQCHKFDGKGHDVGPQLDGADRSVDYLLTNILDPNRVIGQPYYQKVILLKSGQLKTGLLHAEDDATVTLKREQAALEVIQKKEIDIEKTVEKSLMPEGLDKNITPEEFRHLVEYLRRK